MEMIGPSAPTGSFAVNKYIDSRVKLRNTRGVEYTRLCDYNSIMMYPEWRKAAVKARNAQEDGVAALAQRYSVDRTPIALPLQTEGEELSGLSSLDGHTIRQLYSRMG